MTIRWACASVIQRSVHCELHGHWYAHLKYKLCCRLCPEAFSPSGPWWRAPWRRATTRTPDWSDRHALTSRECLLYRRHRDSRLPGRCLSPTLDPWLALLSPQTEALKWYLFTTYIPFFFDNVLTLILTSSWMPFQHTRQSREPKRKHVGSRHRRRFRRWRRCLLLLRCLYMIFCELGAGSICVPRTAADFYQRWPLCPRFV